MSDYEIYIILGDPIPLKRARVTKNGTYDPQKKEKEQIQYMMRANYGLLTPFKGPIDLDLRFGMPIPKSYSKKRKEALLNNCHSCKPDLSNLIKFYEDALTGILWEDDSQIYKIAATKTYCKSPHVTITIKEVQNGM